MQKNQKYSLVLATFFFLLGLFFLSLSSGRIHASLQDYAGKNAPKSIELPYKAAFDAVYVNAVYTLNFSDRDWDLARIAVIPDNCVRSIEMNGRAVDLTSFSPSALCNFEHGLTFDASTYIKSGTNKMKITVHNKGRSYGLNVRLNSITDIVGKMLLGLSAALLMYWVARISSFDTITTCIWLASLPYFLYWLFYFSNSAYTNDLGGHINYIRYIASNPFDPYGYNGRERWHPPLYYYFAGLVYRISSGLFTVDPLSSVRVFSLALYQIFCWYGLRTLCVIIKNKTPAFYAGVALIIFWPVSILMATRINNDIAMYAAWSASFYYLTVWYTEPTLHRFRYVVATLAICLMIKSNAVIPVGIASATLFYSLIKQKISWRYFIAKAQLVNAILFLFGVFINIGRLLFREESNLHFGGAGGGVVTFASLFGFNLAYFIDHPFNTIWKEPTFLNNFLKTTLYGEFSFNHPDIALVLNVILLLFLAFLVLITAINIISDRSLLDKLLPYLLGWIVPLLGVIAFYAIKRMEVCQDFRFALPLLVPMCILYAYNLDRIRPNKFMLIPYWLGISISLALPLLASLFYLMQYL